MLLGLLTVREGRGAEVLAALGTEPDRLREAVLARVAADAS
nr:Clp protease N-terminal domain-containing protein [Streptomyces tardus]